MDTQTLITEAKARFAHNLAKITLKEKYDSKLIVAEQNGLWKADIQTISFLNSFKEKEVIMLDTFNNPVKVDRKLLLEQLKTIYLSVTEEWYKEYMELEGKR